MDRKKFDARNLIMHLDSFYEAYEKLFGEDASAKEYRELRRVACLGLGIDPSSGRGLKVASLPLPFPKD